MKKSLLAGTLLCLFAGQVAAQSKGIYVKFGAGYQFAVARQPMQFSNLARSSTTYVESHTRHSLQNGFAPIVGIGCMVSKNIGFEFGASYVFGTSSEIKQSYSEPGMSQQHNMEVRSRSLMITPSLRLAAPLGKDLSIYSRSGLVIPVLSRVQKQLKSSYAEQGLFADIEAHSVVRNHFALGFSGAAGLAYKTSDKVTLNLELAGQMLNLWSKKENITTFKVNGITADPKSFGFSKETIHAEIAKSSQALSYQSPFHSLGINLGLSFSL